jgi:hypothetical protein
MKKTLKEIINTIIKATGFTEEIILNQTPETVKTWYDKARALEIAQADIDIIKLCSFKNK